MAGDSFALTMRAKLPNAFRFGLTGTPIDKTMVNTHRDFGPIKDGNQERYLSYYGIRRAIKDGATLEVHYQLDKVPFNVEEKTLNVSFEQMCEDAEVSDEEAKDVIQKQRAKWKELARHPDRIEIVLGKMLKHFLEHPDPNGFKAQLVGVDRKACALYKIALDEKLKAQGLPPEWSEVIISSSQNTSDEEVRRFEYEKSKQDELIEYFKLTPAEWEKWNHERHGDDRSKWRPALKILIVCDRLITGFDAPIEQVMYLDRPLRDHNLLQAIARTNRPLPALKKRTGLVVDYFGVFDKLEKALNFDESVREESLIDWDKLKEMVAGEVARCLETFKGIRIEDTRACLLAALRVLSDATAAKIFEQNFRSLERLWEAVAPDPCLYPHRHNYSWLTTIYVAYRRRKRGSRDTHGELSAKTQQLIEENTTFMQVADELPIFKIDADYITKLENLPTPGDKAAALEEALTAELSEDDPSFTYRMLGQRLAELKKRKDANDAATAKRLSELEELAAEIAKSRQEPERLNLKHPGEYELFTVLRATAKTEDEALLAEAARRLISYLRTNKLLPSGWSTSKEGRQRMEDSLLAESWNDFYQPLGYSQEHPAFIEPSIEELAKLDE
jgi:type I restriction enzyme R subunit